MKRLILVIAALLSMCAAVNAQKDTLYISSRYTSHLMFDNDIVYFDVSYPELVSTKHIEQSPNILAIMAVQPFDIYSSVSILESNGQMHTYIVAYKDSPSQLVVKISGTGQQQATQPARAGARDAEKPSSVFTLSEAVKMSRGLFHLSESNYDVTASCDNIFVNKDKIYMVLGLKNESVKAYDCLDASFVIQPKKRSQRAVGKDPNNLIPINSFGSLSVAPGKEGRKAYCFSNFVLQKDQVLEITVNEDASTGKRQLTLVLDMNDINRAKVL